MLYKELRLSCGVVKLRIECSVWWLNALFGEIAIVNVIVMVCLQYRSSHDVDMQAQWYQPTALSSQQQASVLYSTVHVIISCPFPVYFWILSDS